ncbi:phosphodiester glycosidase family protein [Weissella confusa]|uniref:Phosphodiester glycosidase family protein n=1 Tax=Weissella confusa TaxID=1583 RepID=A0A923NFJ4_WEICO|nr:phosphodiester glycosidase family protein [Weissella confusa]
MVSTGSGVDLASIGGNVVSDGRTSESTGLSLYQLANVMKKHGATYAYNLDGGGSSTMVLNGKVINNPVGGSGQSSERAVSDNNMKSVNQSDETASELLKNGAQQVLSFGPTLVENGKVTVSEDAEVGQSQASNPRTAIGQVGKNHYVATALANNTYGRNYTEKTSSMASEHNAIFAINGDYYGFRDTGYVVRNGTLYRDTVATDTDALVIDSDVLQHSGTAIATSTQTVKKTAKKDSSTVKKTATSYEDSHMSINVTTERVDDTTVYVADITVDDPSLLH